MATSGVPLSATNSGLILWTSCAASFLSFGTENNGGVGGTNPPMPLGEWRKTFMQQQTQTQPCYITIVTSVILDVSTTNTFPSFTIAIISTIALLSIMWHHHKHNDTDWVQASVPCRHQCQLWWWWCSTCLFCLLLLPWHKIVFDVQVFGNVWTQSKRV